MSDEPLKVPKPTGGDAAIAILRAGAGSIPVVGAPAAEIVSWFLKSPLERRRDEWMGRVGATLEELRTKSGVDLEALQSDEGFVDVVMQATQIATRNHQEEKREALCNAIANSAGTHAPEESKRQRFLYLVDAMAPLHLQVLKLFSDPSGWFNVRKRPLPLGSIVGSPEATLHTAFPELRGQRDFYNTVWADLKNFGLVQSPTLQVNMSPEGALQKQTSPYGDEFLGFISSPKTAK